MVAITVLLMLVSRTVTDTCAPPANAARTAGSTEERGAHPDQDRPVLTDQAAGLCDGVADQPLRATRGPARALAQPLDHDDRGAPGSGEHGLERVEATDSGVAEPDALFLVAVDLDDRVVDIEQGVPAGRGRGGGVRGAEQGCACGQTSQEPGGDRVELPHVHER